MYSSKMFLKYSSYYKTCAVPYCKSTTIKTPEKLFVYVPNNKKMRKKWLLLARREDASQLSSDSRMYFCEDHFDLPNDMDNYMEYHIMGSVSQVRMKSGCIPTKFVCQEDRRKRTGVGRERPYIVKKRRREIVNDCLNESKRSKVNATESLNKRSNSSVDKVQEILCEPDLSVETCSSRDVRSIATEIVKIIQQELSPVNTFEAAFRHKKSEAKNSRKEKQMKKKVNVSKKLLHQEQIDFVPEEEIKREPNDYVAEVQQEDNDFNTEDQLKKIYFVTEVHIKRESEDYVSEEQQYQQNYFVAEEFDKQND